MKKDHLSIFSFGNWKYHNFDIKKEQKEKKEKERTGPGATTTRQSACIFCPVYLFYSHSSKKKYLKKKKNTIYAWIHLYMENLNTNSKHNWK
jgi:hypothetical protein